VLTHDSAITERHYADERDNIRATEVTVRFGAALSAAQEGLSVGTQLNQTVGIGGH